MLGEDAEPYYRRLELLAELVLKAVATNNQKNDEGGR